uniref:Uncharacterized protein n=1 Tax=Glossina austeni TaxID=7395 RepID=A0A1A9V219_GLOAU
MCVDTFTCMQVTDMQRYYDSDDVSCGVGVSLFRFCLQKCTHTLAPARLHLHNLRHVISSVISKGNKPNNSSNVMQYVLQQHYFDDDFHMCSTYTHTHHSRILEDVEKYNILSSCKMLLIGVKYPLDDAYFIILILIQGRMKLTACFPTSNRVIRLKWHSEKPRVEEYDHICNLLAFERQREQQFIFEQQNA